MMVTIPELWLPILLSAVAVFVLSSIINMFLPYHRTDYAKLPDEDQVMAELRRAGVPPGDFAFPHASAPSQMNDEAWIAKATQGPVGMLTVRPSGPPSMGPALAMWFVYAIVVSLFAAYIAGRTLSPGTDYLMVFRITATVAFSAYVMALWQHAIWYDRSWSTTFKFTFDGLVYALFTGGLFGWLWP
jgi:hypothetical protein